MDTRSFKGETLRLASFVSKLQFSDLPGEVVNHIKLCILDTIGCGLFGSALPWGQLMARFVEAQAGVLESSVWGHGVKVPSANAALANGTMVHGFELDDLHKGGIVHPGSTTVTAALAVAEGKRNVSGADLLTAVVAGYELAARVGMSVGVSHLVAGFHPTGTCGTFSAGAAAARVLGVDEMTTANCLGIAGTQGRHKVTVEVRHRNGSLLTETVEHGKGSPRYPLTGDEVRGKFRILAEKARSKNEVEQLVDIIDGLERLADISDLSAILSIGAN
ncbi:MAG: MmgE/PrpD family protein [Candidatus Eisenbacteria bacterium]|nr:MmgE/PrpD family protein [Candidatus Eisenbacteria bacterium]